MGIQTSLTSFCPIFPEAKVTHKSLLRFQYHNVYEKQRKEEKDVFQVRQLR